MRAKARRRLDVLLIAAGGVAAAGVAAIGAVGFNEERLDRMWTSAEFAPDGTAHIHEVIDYNFGNASERHGLLRQVPSLPPTAPLTVSSPDAPDGINSIIPFQFSDGTMGSEIRVGDATKVVSGHHRYSLDYGLSTLLQGTSLVWNSVGTGWQVPIEETDVQLVAPFALEHVTCQTGVKGHTSPCEARTVAPGHLVVHVGKLEKARGLTIEAQRGADLPGGAPVLAAAPSTRPDDPGSGIGLPAEIALATVLVAGLVTSKAIRLAGRERVGAGAAGADVAFAQTSESQVRIDSNKLADLATTEFAPPQGITSAMGGVILDEQVKANHKVAWLIEAAIAGAVEIEEEKGKATSIKRLAPGDAGMERVLDKMFGGRDEIALGTYDKTFASGWAELDQELDRWAKGSELWDDAADGRKARVRVLGILALVVGGIAVGAGGALAGRWGTPWFPLLIGAGIVVGAGLAGTIRAWELRVRTVKGSGMFLRVESFRRFLHESESTHTEEAARLGVLREYTAWAVAVGEVDHWRKAVESSTTIPQDTLGLGYVLLAPSLMSSTSHSATAPSSSGGSGGGGMGGGGGGGGGGGSW